jgi:hypothetical protein
LFDALSTLKCSLKLSRRIRSAARSRGPYLDPIGICLADVGDGTPRVADLQRAAVYSVLEPRAEVT